MQVTQLTSYGDPSKSLQFVELPEPRRPGLVSLGRFQAPVAAIYPLSAIGDAVAHTLHGGNILLEVSPRAGGS